MSAAEIAIRPAEWRDREAILALVLAMGEHDTIAGNEDPLRRLGATLQRCDARVLVAQEPGGDIAGVVELHARASMVNDRFEGWIGTLAVAPQRRGMGVGRALIDAAQQAARQLGCDVLVLEASQTRATAHAFYRAAGFEERPTARRFALAITAPPAAPLNERFLIAAARAANAGLAAVAGLQAIAAVAIGADGAPTEAADAAAERAAIRELSALGVPIVSEEAGVVGARPQLAEPWISLDPLDGSRNYRAAFPMYGIAIGLVRDGVPIAGFVADFNTGRRWWTDGGLAYADGRRIAAKRGPLAAVPSPSPGATVRVPSHCERIRISGSTALDLCRVADGSLSAFVALDRRVVHVHDLAGPMAVILVAGGSVITSEGTAPYLEPDPKQTFALVAAADDSLARALLADRVGAAGEERADGTGKCKEWPLPQSEPR